MYFPFVRSKVFSIGELRSFEQKLLAEAQVDKALRKAWRVPDTDEMKRWVKIREETYPIMLLADRKSYPDDATFFLMPAGTPNIDAEIKAQSEIFNLQITIADPIWIDDQGTTSNGGYDHRLSMEELNKSGFVHSSGLMRRDNGKIISELSPLLSPEQEFAACTNGLVDALKRKLSKSTSRCRLLVHARDYSQRRMHFTFESVARRATDALQLEIRSASYEKYYFVDEGRESYFEY